MIKSISQRDRRWSGFRLLNGPLTIGMYGCLLVTLTAGINHILGTSYTPKQVNDKLVAAGYGRKDSLYTWYALLKTFFVIERIVDVRNVAVSQAQLNELKAWLQRGRVASIQVDMNPNTNKADMHFVIAYGWTRDGRVQIMDPWTGKMTTIRDSYFGAKVKNLERAIYRIVYLSAKNPTSPPPFKPEPKPDPKPVPKPDNSEAVRKAVKELQKQLGDASSAAKKLYDVL